MQTVHFGEVEVSENDIITFANGIVPFVKTREFTLLAKEEEAPFCWLQSVEEPALAFVCAPVADLFPEHEATIRKGTSLTDEERESSEILAIIVLAEEAPGATANLLAPVIVDRARRQGRQVIRDGDMALCRVPIAAGEESHAGAHAASQ